MLMTHMISIFHWIYIYHLYIWYICKCVYIYTHIFLQIPEFLPSPYLPSPLEFQAGISNLKCPNPNSLFLPLSNLHLQASHLNKCYLIFSGVQDQNLVLFLDPNLPLVFHTQSTNKHFRNDLQHTFRIHPFWPPPLISLCSKSSSSLK